MYEAGGFDRSFRLLRTASQGELITDNLSIMIINHGGQMAPAVLPAQYMCHIHGQPAITLRRPTPTTLDPQP